jgi:hypothetical protein
MGSIWLRRKLQMKRIVPLLTVLGLFLLVSPSANSLIPTPPDDNAVFHQDGDCNSFYTIALRVGDYPDLGSYHLGDIGSPTWNDQISCMTIGLNISKVIVYEHTNFKGKRKEFSRNTNTNSLGSWSFAGGDWWNDKISSIKVIGPGPANKVVFFQDGDYNGNYMQLGKGEYKDIRSYTTGGTGSPNWNDQISSMKIGTGISKVTVYWDTNFGGSKREFKRQADNPDGCWSLTGDGWNDKISGIKIE